MYVVTDSNTGDKETYKKLHTALGVSLIMNDIGNEAIRGAIVTALHWIEQVDEPQ